MRISCLKVDAGFEEFLKHKHKDITVSVDGVIVPKCITADDYIGYVKAYKTDCNGILILNRKRDACITYELHGDVVIDFAKLIEDE